MTNEIKAFELSDEQLNMVAGGPSQSNGSTSANVAYTSIVNPTADSLLLGSAAGNTSLGQTNATSQNNTNIKGWLW